MYCSFSPYYGREKYIFVSCAYKDEDLVKPILERLHAVGFRIWYDNGIDWAVVPKLTRLQKCGVCLVFHSKNSVNSPNCKHEIKYSLECKKEILSVYLEEVSLSAGIEMGLSQYREAFRYQYSDKDEELFFERLMQAEPLQPCKVKNKKAENKIVEFHDANIEQKVRKICNVHNDDNVTEKMILNITILALNGSTPALRDISYIAMFKNLHFLNLSGNQISDITPLAGLANLKWLNLGGNQISDITPLASLVNLTKLDLWENQISDLTPLASLVNLPSLNLNSNQISDLTPLANLVNLKELYLRNNQISDITPLLELVNLRELFISDNQISDTQLRKLKIHLQNAGKSLH